MQFIDQTEIAVAAGDGGDGIVAWRREKYVPKGGPAGGDGGHGGNVYLEATPELSTLVEFRYRRNFSAQSGKPGGSSNKSGKSGEDLTIEVPVGTLVFKTRSDGERDFLADLKEAGARVLAAKGGRGGLGNQHFATSVRQAPRFAERGEPGERFTLQLELRLLADCGIVGVPNAGKSTLLFGYLGGASEDCRLSLHDARAATRSRPRLRRGFVRDGRRARFGRRRTRRRRLRRPVPQTRRAYACAGAFARRREAVERDPRRQGDDRIGADRLESRAL